MGEDGKNVKKWDEPPILKAIVRMEAPDKKQYTDLMPYVRQLFKVAPYFS